MASTSTEELKASTDSRPASSSSNKTTPSLGMGNSRRSDNSDGPSPDIRIERLEPSVGALDDKRCPSRTPRTPWSRKTPYSNYTDDLFGGGDKSAESSEEELPNDESALTFRDVAFSVGKGDKEKQILAPCSGHFAPGSVSAVMGPSGSGKTTLVDILAGKKTSHYQGTVHFNGRPRDKLFARMTGYVPQNDYMPAYSTVKEAVMFHAALKAEWPRGFTSEQRRKLLERRLKLFGLYDVRNSRIGDGQARGISGGQRRRLSLARSIATGARLIFCDEPTSGLSATDAETCVQYIRRVADKLHTTIVVVIHQPRIEVAELFDHLILLTSNPGRVVYNGPMTGAVAHFEAVLGRALPSRVNPLDFCMDLVTPGARGSQEEDCVQYYELHCRPAVDALVEDQLETKRAEPIEMLEAQRKKMAKWGYLPPVRKNKYGVRFRRQLLIVFKRQLTLAMRDKQGFIAELVVAFAKALVVGLAYMKIGNLDAFQQCGFFFMVLMSVSIDGMKDMPKVINDRMIMKSEVSEALYSEWAYIISFTIINWVQSFLSNAIFTLVLFWMSGLSWDLFGSVFLWTSTLSITFGSMYLMIAAIGKDSAVAFVMSLPFLMLFMLYNGFTVTKKTVPSFMRWALDISPVAYGMEALVLDAADVYESAHSMYPVLLDQFGYERRSKKALEVMCSCFLLFRAIQIIALKKMNNLQR